MQANLKKLKETPLGISVVRRALPKFRVMLYDDLPATPDYSKVVKGKEGVVLLYQLHSRGRPTDGMGHYVLVQRDTDGKIIYFSSYGLRPEQEIAATHSRGKLIRMLGKNFRRNTIGFQKKSHTATCGRWVILKARLASVSLKQFTAIFSRRVQLAPDELVSLATMFVS